MADWVTISSLATAGGTLVLAAATFASVRSANRAARVAERSLLVGLRPVLVPSRPQDPPERVDFRDAVAFSVPGGGAMVEESGGVIYLAMPLRNVGSGLAVLHGWYLLAGLPAGTPTQAHEDPAAFRVTYRDIYIAPDDTGYWQAAIRDADDPWRPTVQDAMSQRQPLTIDVMYGDHEGVQREITRFAIRPDDENTWAAQVGRHWSLDGPDPHPR
jgi:hypothetical protein